MTIRSLVRIAVLLACGLLGGGAAQAAPRQVEVFDLSTWQALQTQLKKPAVVVFSTTDCTHCPGVLTHLAQFVRQRKLPATVMAVVMDVAPGDADDKLLSHAHYRRSARLWAFAGQASALRYSVNPAWRGVTPYVALLVPGQPPRWVTGPPSEADLAPWAHAAAGF